MSTRLYTKAISGNECIGNSLSTINSNFAEIDTGLQTLTDTVNSNHYTLPKAGNGINGVLGGVKVGAGLTVDSNGVLNNDTLFTFTGGLNLGRDNVVTFKPDNITLEVNGDGAVAVMKSHEDTWVNSNSASIKTLIDTTDTRLTTLTNKLSDANQAISSLGSRTDKMQNTLAAVTTLEQLLSVQITEQPMSIVGVEGDSVSISLKATPTNVNFLPIQYRWYHTTYSGTTAIANLLTAEVNQSIVTKIPGRYYCLCSNSISHVRSTDAIVRFNNRVGITVQPISQVLQGTTHTLTIEASGTQPIHYQWLMDDIIIDGATSIHYITSLPGRYNCIVSNMVNSVTSVNAILSQ